MKNGKRFVFCHIDLIQYAEAAHFRTLVDRPMAQSDFSVAKSIGAYQRGCVGIEIKGNIPFRAIKHGGQVFREHVFSRRFRTDKQEVFARQQGGKRHFPYIVSVIAIDRPGYAVR